MSAFLKLVVLGLLAILSAVVIAIVTPLLYVAGGYLTGWVLQSVFPTVGDWVVMGSAALGIEFAREQLPVIGSLLGFVGAFFRASQLNKTEK